MPDSWVSVAIVTFIRYWIVVMMQSMVVLERTVTMEPRPPFDPESD